MYSLSLQSLILPVSPPMVEEYRTLGVSLIRVLSHSWELDSWNLTSTQRPSSITRVNISTVNLRVQKHLHNSLETGKFFYWFICHKLTEKFSQKCLWTRVLPGKRLSYSHGNCSSYWGLRKMSTLVTWLGRTNKLTFSYACFLAWGWGGVEGGKAVLVLSQRSPWKDHLVSMLDKKMHLVKHRT